MSETPENTASASGTSSRGGFGRTLRWLALGLVATVAVVALLFGLRILTPSMFGTFRIAKVSQQEIIVPLPLQFVLQNLMMSGVQERIMQELGVEMQESQSITKKLNLNPMSLMSGKWDAETVDESEVVFSDPTMGKLRARIRAEMRAKPGHVSTVTRLKEPTEYLNDFSQKITMTPLENNPRKTRIVVEYETDITVQYPGFAFLRAYAEQQLADAHAKTLEIICNTLADGAVGQKPKL